MDKEKIVIKKVKGGTTKMRTFEEQKTADIMSQKSTESFAKETTKPIIVTARPGLTGIESALVRRIPSNYTGKTVQDVLGYIIDSEIKDEEADTAKRGCSHK